MEPFYFGPESRQLFGSYHPPLSGHGRVVTVICPPLFSELTRTQRALRKVAIALAEAGQHVLRFDYRGTGDSFGNIEDATISDWVEDIALTVREGREISGCETVRILGVRAGALLACSSVGTTSDVQRLVLWDPITDGGAYLQALRRVQETVVNRHINLSRAERREALHEFEYGGPYRLSERMVEEFHALDSSAYLKVSKSKLHVISTSSANGFPANGFPANGISREVVRFACSWEQDAENLVTAHPVLERLIVCLTMP